MNRPEAVAILQDILINFSGRYIDSFGVTKSGEKGIEGSGYKLYIKGTLDESTKKKIALLAEKYNLSIKEENGLVLFEPTVINLQVIN